MESIADKQQRILKIIATLQEATKEMPPTASTEIVRLFGKDPFLVLISCLLSLRTKDTVSLPASCRLFSHATTPQSLLHLPIKEIEKLIYPVGFYRRKAKILCTVSQELLERFNGKVPATEEELLSLPGVGRKTMNLVLGQGFGIPAMCVDTHVHRISNRLALVKTTNPTETEKALKEIVPRSCWIEFNHLLVKWGQNICVPISPFCSRCAINTLCPKIGVTKSR